ncbi:MAG: hypothetical protein FWB86_10475 [Treponema sp.]|nr:hypothetical protein [Treponema sp.]MCL2251372.1 hypothetical protein [Treponema sp.]
MNFIKKIGIIVFLAAIGLLVFGCNEEESDPINVNMSVPGLSELESSGKTSVASPKEAEELFEEVSEEIVGVIMGVIEDIMTSVNTNMYGGAASPNMLSFLTPSSARAVNVELNGDESSISYLVTFADEPCGEGTVNGFVSANMSGNETSMNVSGKAKVSIDLDSEVIKGKLTVSLNGSVKQNSDGMSVNMSISTNNAFTVIGQSKGMKVLMSASFNFKETISMESEPTEEEIGNWVENANISLSIYKDNGALVQKFSKEDILQLIENAVSAAGEPAP